jgi:hypothetical protein
MNFKNLFYLSILLSLVTNAYGVEGVKFDGVTKSIYDDIIKFIDGHIGVFALLSAAGGILIAQGDLRTRAIGGVTGMATLLIVWTISKTLLFA